MGEGQWRQSTVGEVGDGRIAWRNTERICDGEIRIAVGEAPDEKEELGENEALFAVPMASAAVAAKTMFGSCSRCRWRARHVPVGFLDGSVRTPELEMLDEVQGAVPPHVAALRRILSSVSLSVCLNQLK